MTGLLLAALLQTLPQPQFEKTCVGFTESTCQSLIADLTSSQTSCTLYAYGYIEGVWDLGAGLIWKAPESAELGELVKTVKVFILENRSRIPLGTPASLCVVGAYLDKYGEKE